MISLNLHISLCIRTLFQCPVVSELNHINAELKLSVMWGDVMLCNGKQNLQLCCEDLGSHK